MTEKKITVQTTPQRARVLQQMINQAESGSIVGDAASRPVGLMNPVMVEIKENIEQNDRQAQDAYLLNLNGNIWEKTGQQVPIRNLSETPLYKGLRIQAVPSGRLGLVIPVPHRIRVRLKTDLYAAVDTETDPSFADAWVMYPDANGDLQTSTETIEIVNRFENISVDAGTYAKAEPFWSPQGIEWELYAADCPPTSISGSSPVTSESTSGLSNSDSVSAPPP